MAMTKAEAQRKMQEELGKVFDKLKLANQNIHTVVGMLTSKIGEMNPEDMTREERMLQREALSCLKVHISHLGKSLEGLFMSCVNANITDAPLIERVVDETNTILETIKSAGYLVVPSGQKEMSKVEGLQKLLDGVNHKFEDLACKVVASTPGKDVSPDWDEKFSNELNKKCWVHKVAGSQTFQPPVVLENTFGTGGQWEEFYSKKIGQRYWKNSKTGEIVLIRPKGVENSGIPYAELPVDEEIDLSLFGSKQTEWQEEYSTRTEKSYWKNKKTGNITFDCIGAAAAGDVEESLDDAIPVWQECFSESVGKTYWKNAKTGEMTLIKPDGFQSGGEIKISEDIDFNAFGAEQVWEPVKGKKGETVYRNKITGNICMTKPGESTASTADNWKTKYSKACDVHFWQNEKTGEITLTKPHRMPDPSKLKPQDIVTDDSVDLSAMGSKQVWEETYSEKLNAPVWKNKITGNVTFDKIAALRADDVEEALPQGLAGGAGGSASEGVWEEKYSAIEQRSYWKNVATGEMSLTKPKGVILTADEDDVEVDERVDFAILENKVNTSKAAESSKEKDKVFMRHDIGEATFDKIKFTLTNISDWIQTCSDAAKITGVDKQYLQIRRRGYAEAIQKLESNYKRSADAGLVRTEVMTELAAEASSMLNRIVDVHSDIANKVLDDPANTLIDTVKGFSETVIKLSAKVIEVPKDRIAAAAAAQAAWEEKYSVTEDKVVWKNKETGAVSVEKPKEVIAAEAAMAETIAHDQADVESAWEEIYSPILKRKIWKNKITGETTFEDPLFRMVAEEPKLDPISASDAFDADENPEVEAAETAAGGAGPEKKEKRKVWRNKKTGELVYEDPALTKKEKKDKKDKKEKKDKKKKGDKGPSEDAVAVDGNAISSTAQQWEQKYSHKMQKPIWVNNQTGQVSWDLATAGLTGLVAGTGTGSGGIDLGAEGAWEEKYSAKEKMKWYKNNVTGAMTAIKPAGFVSSGDLDVDENFDFSVVGAVPDQPLTMIEEEEEGIVSPAVAGKSLENLSKSLKTIGNVMYSSMEPCATAAPEMSGSCQEAYTMFQTASSRLEQVFTRAVEANALTTEAAADVSSETAMMLNEITDAYAAVCSAKEEGCSPAETARRVEDMQCLMDSFAITLDYMSDKIEKQTAETETKKAASATSNATAQKMAAVEADIAKKASALPPKQAGEFNKVAGNLSSITQLFGAITENGGEHLSPAEKAAMKQIAQKLAVVSGTLRSEYVSRAGDGSMSQEVIDQVGSEVAALLQVLASESEAIKNDSLYNIESEGKGKGSHLAKDAKKRQEIALLSLLESANSSLEKVANKVAGKGTAEMDVGLEAIAEEDEELPKLAKTIQMVSIDDDPELSAAEKVKEKKKEAARAEKAAAEKKEKQKAISGLKISDDSFDADDISKRPAGWKNIRMRRVRELEQKDRNEGVAESTILMMRPRREVEVENTMIKEAGVIGRIKALESRINKNATASKPCFPTGFHVKLAGHAAK